MATVGSPDCCDAANERRGRGPGRIAVPIAGPALGSIDQRVDRSVLGAGAFDPFLAFGHGCPCRRGTQTAVPDIVEDRRIGLRLRDGRIFTKSILRQGGFSGLGKSAARDRAAGSAWRQSTFCRLQAAILPFFDASSSYDTRWFCSSVAMPARSTALM